MTSPARTERSALTVVVVDNATASDASRLVSQLLKHSPAGLDIVLASLRSPHLPPAAARRVRRLRATTGALMDTAVAREATAATTVVVASAATTVRAGWIEEVAARARLYPEAVSGVEAGNGGILLYPTRVVSTDVPTVVWLSPQTMTVRSRSARSGSAQTISAVMIVKDEEDVLADCLTAITPFVDEVVVYDTGSTDATVQIARDHGAVVVEGYWDDHFGDARNRALAHATGEWVLQVDADEVAEGDPAELRARLSVEEAGQLHIPVVSSSWQGVESGLETLPIRLFRREGMAWVGALHEFPRRMDDQPVAVSSVPAPLRLQHSGYNLGKVMDRDKTTRNIALSRRELDQAAPDAPNRAELMSNLVRSLMWAHRVEEAIPLFDELRTTPGNPTAICISGRAAVELMVSVGRADEADRWLETLEGVGEAPGNIAVMRARRHLSSGDVAQANAVLRPFAEGRDGGVDPWSKPFDRVQLEVVAAEIDLFRGDAAAAADRFLRLVPHSSNVLPLDVLLKTFVAAGRPFSDLASIAPEELVARSVREASTFHPSGALAWFDALHETRTEDVRPVVAGNLFAARDGWQTALTWSVRAREMDLGEVCALRDLTARESAPVVDRCIAAALRFQFFDDVAAGERFTDLTTQVAEADLPALQHALAEVGIDVELNLPDDSTTGVSAGV